MLPEEVCCDSLKQLPYAGQICQGTYLDRAEGFLKGLIFKIECTNDKSNYVGFCVIRRLIYIIYVLNISLGGIL